MSDPLIQFLAATQNEQSRLLRDLSDSMARVEERLSTRSEDGTRRDIRIDGIATQVDEIKHDVTRAKTAFRILCAGLGMVGTAVAWLLSR